MEARWRGTAARLAAGLALAAVLVLASAWPAAAAPVGAGPVRVLDTGGCVLPTAVIDLGALGKFTLPSPDPVAWVGYIGCVMVSFFTAAITWVAQSVVAAVYEVAGTIAGAISWIGSAVINAFMSLVAAIETPLLQLGIIAPIASAIAMLILVALGVTISYFLIVVLNKLYEAA